MQGRLLEYIIQLNNSIRTNNIKDLSTLSDLLISINYFSKKTNSSIKVRNSHELIQTSDITEDCPACKLAQYLIKTDCGHSFCRACLRSNLLSQSNNSLVGKLVCMECGQDISSNIVYRVFGSTKKVAEIKESSGFISEKPKFICQVCTHESFIENSITLDCNHRYCKDCMKLFLHNLISSNQVDESEFHCPECPAAIHPEVVKYLCPEVYSKFLDFSLKNYKPPENAMLKICHFCEYRMEIPVTLKEIKCNGCGNIYCPQCNKKHSGRGCERERIEAKEVVIDGVVVKYCPKCGGAVEKISGCNFIKCPYPDCRESFFCYLCLKLLKFSQHYSHYFNEGPSGETCNTIDNLVD